MRDVIFQKRATIKANATQVYLVFNIAQQHACTLRTITKLTTISRNHGQSVNDVAAASRLAESPTSLFYLSNLCEIIACPWVFHLRSSKSNTFRDRKQSNNGEKRNQSIETRIPAENKLFEEKS